MHHNVGDIRIVSIQEQSINGLEHLIKEANPQSLAAIDWLSPHYINSQGELTGLIQTFVIDTGAMKIVVDTCVGNDKDRPHDPQWHQQQRDFLQRFEAAGFTCESVDYVLCTHLHVDHVGWNTYWTGDKWAVTFPNARYLFARSEFEHWQRESVTTETAPPADESRKDAALRQFRDTQRRTWSDSVKPVFDAGQAELVGTNHRICEQVELVPTPGHTIGHVSVRVSSGDAQAVISGDCVHHPCQIAEPSWRTLVDHDVEQAGQTRVGLFTSLAKNGGTLIGSHFAEPCCGTLEHDGDGFRFTGTRTTD